MVFTPDREELAWAGGFYSGEGCTRINTTKTTKKFVRPRDYHRTAMQLVQCTEDGAMPEVLLRFKTAIANLGNITGPYKQRHDRGKPYYTWSASKFVEVQAIIAMLWPWLSEVKQEQASSCIKRAAASSLIPAYTKRAVQPEAVI